jgi:hypothetical protein
MFGVEWRVNSELKIPNEKILRFPSGMFRRILSYSMTQVENNIVLVLLSKRFIS